MKHAAEVCLRLFLAGILLFVGGCDAVLGLDATPFVGSGHDGGGQGATGPTLDATVSDGRAGDAGGAPIETSDGSPDATVTDTDTNPDTDTGAGSSDAGLDSQPASSDAANDGQAGSSPVSLQNCVLLMHMDEAAWDPDGGVVIDSSGQGNNGALVGSTVQTVDNGKFGRAAQFGGSGFIAIPDSPSLTPTTALTYAAWINPTGFPGPNTQYPGILAKRQGFDEDSAFAVFLWSNNNIYADIEDYRMNSVGAITGAQGWTHVAVVYDGTLADSTKRVSIYINGVLDSSSDGGTSMSPHDEDLCVGYLPGAITDPNAYYVGLIDEVAVWTRALSATEIATLYSATTPL